MSVLVSCAPRETLSGACQAEINANFLISQNVKILNTRHNVSANEVEEYYYRLMVHLSGNPEQTIEPRQAEEYRTAARDYAQANLQKEASLSDLIVDKHDGGAAQYKALCYESEAECACLYDKRKDFECIINFRSGVGNCLRD